MHLKNTNLAQIDQFHQRNVIYSRHDIAEAIAHFAIIHSFT